MKDEKPGQPALKAIAGTQGRPVKQGGYELQAYVLDNEKRVFTQNSLFTLLGISKSGRRKGGAQLALFWDRHPFNTFITTELKSVLPPISFYVGKTLHYGYEATVLAEICTMVLNAFRGGALPNDKYGDLTARAANLILAFAKTGIIALVDEATGYQEVRHRDALQKILELYISKELMPWTKRFPLEFYKELFRLKAWDFNPPQLKKPSIVGRYTDWVIYERLPPGVLEELRKSNPVSDTGNRRHKHHQFLTPDIGNQQLQRQIVSAIAIMRASSNWRGFVASYNRAYPLPEGLFADPDAEG